MIPIIEVQDMESQRVTKQPDGSYRWICRIDTAFHKDQTKAGYWAVAAIIAFVILAGFFMAARNRAWNTLWIPLLVSGVVLLIALPLLHMSMNAEAPMEEYWMNDDYLKAGYGRNAVFTHFRIVQSLNVFPDHLELVEKGKTRRIYVPPEDIGLVTSYIIDHLLDSASVRRKS